MFAFVARQPILDREKQVFAYELVFRDGPQGMLPIAENGELQSYPEQTLPLALEDISSQKKSFITIDRNTLLNHFPNALDPSNVVVEISGRFPVNDNVINACKELRALGYPLALDAPNLDNGMAPLFPLVDVVKVDVSKSDYGVIEQQIAALLAARVKLVAEQVQTQQDFGICRDLGFDFFQGYFFTRPESLKTSKLPAGKMNLASLIAESTNQQFNLDRVNDIISKDAALSYMLLRFINNPTVNKRQKITSLRHALNYLGEVEVKKFIALLALANLADDKPMELIHLSLVRAHFCDLLAQHCQQGDNPPTAFMVGLFSCLDGLLDQSMPDILEQIPVDDQISLALLGEMNQLHFYLQLTRAFESASWLRLKQMCAQLRIPQHVAHRLFNQAIVWGNQMRTSLSPHFPAAKP